LGGHPQQMGYLIYEFEGDALLATFYVAGPAKPQLVTKRQLLLPLPFAEFPKPSAKFSLR
jgi:hypothetical protein